MNRKNIETQLITQGRIIKSGFNDFVRNAWLGIAAISVITITLTIVLFTLVTNNTFSYTVKQFTDRIERSVYLVDNITEADRNRLQTDLSALSNVKSVTYVTKEQALAKYLETIKNNPSLTSAYSITNNPLPASLLVKPKDPSNLQQINDVLNTPQNKALQLSENQVVSDRKDSVEKITKATRFLQQAGVIGVLVFAAVSVLIILNTIRMTVFNRRDELAIMRLLGATKWYIRGPFVVETVIYGLIAATLSIVACSSIFNIAAKAFGSTSLGLLDIKYADKFFSDNFWWLLALQFTLGIGVGIASSVFATRRYLKLKK